MDKPERIKSLIELFQKVSKDMMISHSQHSEISTKSVIAPPIVKGHWMSLILLTGDLFTAKFKTHYNSALAIEFASKQLGPKSSEINKLNDFFKEYCNLVVGVVRRNLNENKIETGMSLPFLTRGFEEIFFFSKESNDQWISNWLITLNDTSIHCSLEINELNSDWSLSEALEDKGGIEFF